MIKLVCKFTFYIFTL